MAALALGVSSCHDDAFDDFNIGIEGGEATVTCTVSLPAFDIAELNNSRAAGNAIRDFENLYILVYEKDAQGNAALRNYELVTRSDMDYDSNGNTEHPDYPYGYDVPDVSQGEAATPCAKFTLREKLVVGKRYEIYAVANVDFSGINLNSAFDTPSKLKDFQVAWERTDISKNRAMMGQFTTEANKNVEGSDIVINSLADCNIHAWLERCASKVTVAFNTDELNDNTWIYLHSVTIHDIPASCHLRRGNKVKEDAGYFADGETIYYDASKSDYKNAKANYESWPVLSKGTGTYGSDHSETADALYFYENLQGNYEGDEDYNKYNKEQNPDKLGSIVNKGDEDYKDNIPFGTYIEVLAYYRSNEKGNMGSGTIKYRFMLGMDTKFDYNAFRNHHYKLTLNFRGNANDVDWHIEYDRTNDNPIYAPNPFYISYLYGENVEIPITIDGKLAEGYKVIAEIVENNWKPLNAPSSVYWTGPVQSSDAAQYDGPWHGFLSLRPTNSKANVIVKNGEKLINSNQIGRQNTISSGIANNAKAYLMSYWYGGIENAPHANTAIGWSSAEIDQNEKMHIPQQGYREFSTDMRGRIDDTSEADNFDSYEIVESQRNGHTTTQLSLPLYTRALFMVKGLAYSGANPYFTYQRKAVLQITCWIEENGVAKKYTKLCDVIQVRRLINPTGIYRDAGDNKSFTAQLCFRTSEQGTTFMPFASEGKWSAEIESGDPGFITLNGQQKVYGKTGEYVKFQVNFSNSSKSGPNRHAVILVKYHDYTCKHRIMVRQGYQPESLGAEGDNTKWHCFNLRGFGKEGESPLETGSLFRFGNKYGIDSSNNRPTDFGTVPADGYVLVDPDGNKLPDRYPWWDNTMDTPDLSKPGLGFEVWTGSNEALFQKKITINNSTYRLAKYDEWAKLRESEEYLYTFGVCYDGNSTSTAMSSDNTFTYNYNNESNTGKGMRGIFVYNRETGKNMFLPIGASGYGRRKSGYRFYGSTDTGGVLRYANRSVFMPSGNAQKTPQFWNIKDNLGAIYWGYPDWQTRQDLWNGTTLSGFSAWDINVSTYDFNQFGTNAYVREQRDNAGSNFSLTSGTNHYYSDACFIRLVDDN